jgi:branched-chain amino acid transport system permease protein
LFEPTAFDLSAIGTGVVNGLVLGSLYALASLGLALIFGVLDIINFAHGDILMISSYIVYLVALSTGNPWIALLSSLALFALFGAGVYRGIIHYVLGKEPLIQIAITVGLGLILQNLALALFRAEPRALPSTLFPYPLSIGPLTLSANRVFVALVSIILCILVHYYSTRTKLGLASRAVAENREAAWLMGINVPLIYMATFTIGVLLTTTAAFLWMQIGPVDPYLGTIFGLLCWIIVALGGLGGVAGIIASGFIIGVLDSLGSIFLTPSGKYIPMYIAFILTIWFKPRGLFGRR